MATNSNSKSKRIGRTENVQLSDGTEVVLRPLNIKKLKEFMKKFREGQQLDTKDKDFEEKFMNILVDMAAIALSNDLKDATAYLYDDEASRETWEEMVDQDTVSFINEVCGGISFGGGSLDEDFPEMEE